MDLQSTPPVVPALVDTAPPPPKPDGRAVADAAATKDARQPDVPMPIPATPAQTGLVSAAALKADTAPAKVDASDVSQAERTLKPYGINMLPDGPDKSHQQTPDAGNDNRPE